MDPRLTQIQQTTRRTFLKDAQVGLGTIALATLLGRDGQASTLPDRWSRRRRFHATSAWLQP